MTGFSYEIVGGGDRSTDCKQILGAGRLWNTFGNMRLLSKHTYACHNKLKTVCILVFKAIMPWTHTARNNTSTSPPFSDLFILPPQASDIYSRGRGGAFPSKHSVLQVSAELIGIKHDQACSFPRQPRASLLSSRVYPYTNNSDKTTDCVNASTAEHNKARFRLENLHAHSGSRFRLN